jgi:hypothetical protein
VEPALCAVGTAAPAAKTVGVLPESTAFTVTERIDALADALRAAGVPEEKVAELLASAGSAAMHAVTLDALRPAA